MTIRRDALAARREAMGYTQESLAEKLGVEFSTVGRWERGALTPQPWRRPHLARALKVSLEQLDSLLDNSATPDKGTVTEHVRRNQQAWLRVRRAPGVRGRELTELAAWLYPKSQRAPGGHVLAGSG
ncbi:MAG: helix-turn-helix domain-containing protein, partial [Actinomycetes bacterium]